MKPIYFMIVSLLLSQIGLAGGIRTVFVNNKKMAPIYLKLGKTTVLRFPDKPKKVVIGNQNYFGVEFINNDLAIQPLGGVETNLFTYGPHRTYGFILKSCTTCQHDDLIYVKWKARHSSIPKKKSQKQKIPGFKPVGLKFDFNESLRFLITKTIFDSERNLRIFDIQVKNFSKTKVDLSSAILFASRKGRPLLKQGFVISKNALAPGKNSKARLFISGHELKDFSLNIKIGSKKERKIISSRYLK